MWQAQIRENLPLPYVAYPQAWYGAFPAFRETSEAPLYFCECQKQAIFNRLDLWPPGIHCYNDLRYGFKLPDTQDFPQAFYRPLLTSGDRSDDVFVRGLRFRDGLCHMCNRRVPRTTPSLTRSTPPLTLFRFYFRKLCFQHGVCSHLAQILEDRCSPAIRALVPYSPLIYRKSSDGWSGYWGNLRARNDIWREHVNPVADFIHSELISALGFPSCGPSLISETVLYLRTVSALSPHEVIRHYRPKGFRGLSLDMFIPYLSVAIEYQGVQHYEPLDHWGGEAGLARTRERDARKAVLCKGADIRLIYFDGNVTFITEEQIQFAVFGEAGRPGR
jgi:hypothetical protein